MDSLDREIKKKLMILENRKPYSEEVRQYLFEWNRLDWIYGSMRLEGSAVTREGVEKLIQGGYLIEATLEDHTSVAGYLEAFRLLTDMSEMKTDLDQRYLKKLYEVMSPMDEPGYRENNPVLYTLGINPPHFREIPQKLEELFRWLAQDEVLYHPIEKAALLHHKLIAIYPFANRTEALARMALYNQLIRSGYPPFSLDVAEQDYYDMIRDYLKNGRIQEFYDMMVEGIYNKVEIMLRLTEHESFR